METNARKRLWEVNHAYYCSESNYYSNDCHFMFKSWAEFLAEMGDADLDLNLLFRWDWNEGGDFGLPEFGGDDYYRGARLLLFYMGQRKGKFTCCEVEVCRADEPAVIAFLQPRLDCLAALWAPLSPTPAHPQE